MIFAALPWILLYLCIAFEAIEREWKWNIEAKKLRKQIALEYECLFPDDPCDTVKPVFGIECDNCVRWHRPERKK